MFLYQREARFQICMHSHALFLLHGHGSGAVEHCMHKPEIDEVSPSPEGSPTVEDISRLDKREW